MMPPHARLFTAACILALSVACSGASPGSPPAPVGSLAEIELAYHDLRYLKDQMDLTTYRGADRSSRGETIPELLARYKTFRPAVIALLARPDSQTLGKDDRRALAIMRRTMQSELVEQLHVSASAASTAPPHCTYSAESLASRGRDSLSERVYDCYGYAARTILIGGDTLDRLTILGMLGRTEDPETRKRLFLALDPVWRSVNGDNSARSPYRHLVRLDAPSWKAGESPVDASARRLGIDPAAMEKWLVSILEKWRDITNDSLIEPWDAYYEAGKASRALSPRISLEELRAVNDRFYRQLGADPVTLGIQYDLAPRADKTPVAFTTFGRRGIARGEVWQGGEPWIFATYRIGGFDNLAEMLHETGHGIHIAGIRARPALHDWPDSDPYTEALADLAALEMYEPAWQMRHLGDSVQLAESLRAKYFSIVMDIAWSLFEARVHRDPTLDPNSVWTGITRDYLRIKPHNELSWWAMRGQLVNSPGYMMNYAIGAIIIADLRQHTLASRGVITEAGTDWYPWISARLYQFGLARSSREVIEQFLGRPISPEAILADMGRATAR
ncbi:MAG: hypothetical protein H7Z74_12865 [Anaerolineae bacterium]|nr:hypothetical protein [Gemmatimonadaceae bacterium]